MTAAAGHFIGECPITCARCNTWLRIAGTVTRVRCSDAAKYVDLGLGSSPPSRCLRCDKQFGQWRKRGERDRCVPCNNRPPTGDGN